VRISGKRLEKMGFGPFFVWALATMAAMADMVEATLAGMGYELVDAQVSNHGRLLRIFIDRPGGITVDQCADVSRHLSHVFAAEGVDYDRLEVSSPGLDRPLRKAADFERFAGQKVELRTKAPDATGRRRFAGRLKGLADGVVTVDVDGAGVGFRLDEIDRARLVPDL
jgi:ribosome maturation factor RimP